MIPIHATKMNYSYGSGYLIGKKEKKGKHPFILPELLSDPFRKN